MPQAETMLITGVNRGIGNQLFQQALSLGYDVYGTARSTISDLDSNRIIQPIDMNDKKDRQLLKAQLAQKIPQLDILINNAGIMGGMGVFGKDMDYFHPDMEENMLNVFQINVMGPMGIIQSVWSLLNQSKHPRIITISSIMGSLNSQTGGGYYAYRVSKSALNMLTETMKRDFPEVSFYSIHPGWVRTEMGGSQAAISPEESASGILKQIQNIHAFESGSFLDYKGEELPW